MWKKEKLIFKSNFAFPHNVFKSFYSQGCLVELYFNKFTLILNVLGKNFQFEEAVGRLPDSKLPVANQLEDAISTIKSNVRVILDTQAQSKHLKQRNEELEKNNRELERALIAKDKVIQELRLRMPATADRDEIILKAQAKATTEAEINRATKDKDYESEQSMRVAQSTINSLQV